MIGCGGGWFCLIKIMINEVKGDENENKNENCTDGDIAVTCFGFCG